MSATLDRAETPTSDDLFAKAGEQLAALHDAPERDDPAAPDAQPEQDAPRDEQATDDATQPARERDETGRFRPKQPDAQPEQRPADQQQPTPDDYRARSEYLERQLASVRGNVDNAARQAREQAQQEATAQARQMARQAITDELNAQLVNGELSQEQAVAAYQRQQQKWQHEDSQVQHQELSQRETGVRITNVRTAGDQALVALYNQGAPRMAQDFGLDENEVRAVWEPEDERQRFQRAVYQTRMAQEFPGLPFNAAAAEDYLATTATHLRALKGVHDRYRGEVDALKKENEQLRMHLNRDEAGGGLPQPASVRDAPRRKAAETLEEAGDMLQRVLTERGLVPSNGR